MAEFDLWVVASKADLTDKKIRKLAEDYLPNYNLAYLCKQAQLHTLKRWQTNNRILNHAHFSARRLRPQAQG